MKISVQWLIVVLVYCGTSVAGANEEPFFWKKMVSRFATDFSESEVSCRVLAKGNSLDKFTEELANTICPELQRQLQAGNVKKSLLTCVVYNTHSWQNEQERRK